MFLCLLGWCRRFQAGVLWGFELAGGGQSAEAFTGELGELAALGRQHLLEVVWTFGRGHGRDYQFQTSRGKIVRPASLHRLIRVAPRGVLGDSQGG